MITEKDIELIEKHLFGKLSEQEKSVFEQRIKSDTEFSEEAAFIRDLKISAKELTRGELKNKLKKIAGEYKTKEIKNKSAAVTYFSIAASVAVIIGIASLFYWMQSKNGSDINVIAETNTAEINQIITDSANKTTYFSVTTVSDGYGYAEADSTVNNKLPVLTIPSDKYNNHYLYRDTLFLFLPAADNLHFFSFSQQPNFLYFTKGNEYCYSVELKRYENVRLIKEVENQEIKEKLKTVGSF